MPVLIDLHLVFLPGVRHSAKNSSVPVSFLHLQRYRNSECLTLFRLQATLDSLCQLLSVVGRLPSGHLNTSKRALSSFSCRLTEEWETHSND